MLCDLLTTTGFAGHPAAYFHRPSISDWLQSFDLAPETSTPERNVLDTMFKVVIAEGSLNNRIRVCVEEMKAHDRKWESWFTTENITPLRINYESLSEHPTKTLSEILEHLGLDHSLPRSYTWRR